MNHICLTCGQPVKYSILLAETDGKFFLPNQFTRDLPPETANLHETWFCHPCMRMIEDNFRATISYLKQEKGPKFRNQ